MANLQVRNLPDALHRRLRRCAQEHHCTIRDIILEALEREMDRREAHEKVVSPLTGERGRERAI